MRKKRKNYTAQEKIFILKRFLVDRVAVFDLCDEYHLQPTVFYCWQKEFFEYGATDFEKDNASSKRAEQKRLERKRRPAIHQNLTSRTTINSLTRQGQFSISS